MHSANAISNVESYDDGLRKKNWKSNEERIFARSYRCVLIYFLDLEQEQALLYVRKLPSWNSTNFTYYLSHVFVKKNFVFFSRFKLSTVYVLIDFPNLESPPLFAIFLFLAIRETRENYQWRFEVYQLNLYVES